MREVKRLNGQCVNTSAYCQLYKMNVDATWNAFYDTGMFTDGIMLLEFKRVKRVLWIVHENNSNAFVNEK